MIVIAVGAEGSGKEFGVRFGMTSLAAVAQWTECWPVNQRVTGSIPSQGTCLACGPGPQLGVCFSPSLSPSLSLPLKIN